MPAKSKKTDKRRRVASGECAFLLSKEEGCADYIQPSSLPAALPVLCFFPLSLLLPLPSGAFNSLTSPSFLRAPLRSF